jgi:hypothetical protein
MIILTLLGVIAALGSVLVAMYYGHIGTKASKHQQQQESEGRAWQERHEKVALRLAHMNPRGLAAIQPNGPIQNPFGIAFPDPQLRTYILTYIVEDKGGNNFCIARTPDPHQLRSGILRQTVETVERRLEEIDANHPELARFLR